MSTYRERTNRDMSKFRHGSTESIGIPKLVLAALLLALASMSAAASDAWFVGTSSEATFATTTNQSSQSLSEHCADGKEGTCSFILTMTPSCDPGTVSALLASNSHGAASLLILCLDSITIGGAEVHRYVFTDFKPIDAMVRQRGILAFAFPSVDSTFAVIRFDNTNAPEKLDEMLRLGIARDAGSTKDQRL